MKKAKKYISIYSSLVFFFLVFFIPCFKAQALFDYGNPQCSFDPEYCQQMRQRPSEQDISNTPDVFDQKGLPVPSSLAQEIKFTIVRVQITRACIYNPVICEGFSSAIKGGTAFDLFERNEKATIFFSNITNMVGGITLGFGKSVFGVGVAGSILNDWETYREDLQIDRSTVNNIADKVARVSLLCEDGFKCDEFLQQFPEIGEALDRAWRYCRGNNKEHCPSSLKLENLKRDFPETANLIIDLQSAKTDKEIRKIVERNTETNAKALNHLRLQLQASDPFLNDPRFVEEDKTLSDLKKLENIYTNLLKETKDKLKNENLPLQEREELQQNIKDYEKTVEGYQKKQALYKHQKISREGKAWAGAVVSVTQAVVIFAQGTDMPEEVTELLADVGTLGTVAIQGFEIYEAVGNMLIAGLDPTGITAIANATGLVMSLFFGIPTKDEIMFNMMEKMLTNQREILETLYEMDVKLNRIEGKLNMLSKRLDEIKNIMAMNHSEVIENQKEIQETLQTIRNEMRYGFDLLEFKIESQTHNEVIWNARKLYKPYGDWDGSESQKEWFGCRMDRSQCSNSEEILIGSIIQHLSKMSDYSKGLIGINDDDVFANNNDNAKSQIETYLNEPVENRIKILKPMTSWLNRALNEIGVDEIDSYPSVGRPSFQDELFFEYVSLASTLPQEIDDFNQVVPVPYVDEVCQRSQNIEKLAKVMRQNIPKAWLVYLAHSDALRKGLYSFFKQNSNNPLYTKIPVKKNNEGSTELIKMHPEFSFFNRDLNWEELQRFFASREETLAPVGIPYIAPSDCYNVEDCKRSILSRANNFEYCSGRKYKYDGGWVDTVKSRNCQSADKFFTDSIKTAVFNVPFSKINPFSPSRYFNSDRKQWIYESIGDWDKAIMGWGYWSKYKDRLKLAERCDIIAYSTKDYIPASSISIPAHLIHEMNCQHYSGDGVTECCYSYYTNKTEEAISVDIVVPNKSTFILANVQQWRAHLKTLYRDTIDYLNSHELISNWMKAKLALQTMALVGYGQQLYIHPQLSDLRSLIENLPARWAPDMTFSGKDQEETPFTESELKEVVQFFNDIETSYQGDIPILPLPSEETWVSSSLPVPEGVELSLDSSSFLVDKAPAVGFGLPELRRAAFELANFNLYEQLAPVRCQIQK